MAAKEEKLPTLMAGGTTGHTASPVWLRITAFLSLRSPNTQETYTGIVREWCEFLGHKVGTTGGAEAIQGASDAEAMAYRRWLSARPGERPRGVKRGGEACLRPGKKTGLEDTLANATIAKKFACLRRIYRMLIGAGVGVTDNPFDTDRVPPPPKDAGRKRPTEMVDFDLVKAVIGAADPSTPKGLRDQAMLCALFGGGLRRSEVAALRVGDVRRSRNGTTYLYLRATKAKRDAEQALPPWAAQVITTLTQARLRDGAGPVDFLFLSYQGQAGKTPTKDAVSASGIYKLFKHYCALAGAGPNLTPHSARATAITRLLAAGVPHRQVQEFSRHSSIQMVEVYDKRRIGVDENPGVDLSYDDE